MIYGSVQELVTAEAGRLAKGPVGLMFAEDDAALSSSLRHALGLGFKPLILFHPPHVAPEADLADQILQVRFNPYAPNAVPQAVNALIDAAPGVWFSYFYNAEFLFFPFCEFRSIAEMLVFHTEERRDAMLTYVVDLYAGDLAAHPDAVDPDQACLDRAGYYALDRFDGQGRRLDRQYDFHGGLRWRFEEHVPPDRRNIDRIGIFRAKPGLRLLPGHRFNDEEYNAVSCEWHHNLTAAICSFRVAKALKTNPGSRDQIDTFLWHNSARFNWSSAQLMDLGLMEPGQWF